jgi:ribosomal-protein-alanine N-acetyltransferase
MTLKTLSLNTLDRVYAIEQQAHCHPWSKMSLKSAFIHNQVMGLYRQTELLGFAIILNTLDALELLNIAVAPPFQCQGYGRRLLHAVIGLAQEQNIARILLEVRVSNQRAQRFYQALGFIEIHRRKGYYVTQGNLEDALIMEYKV